MTVLSRKHVVTSCVDSGDHFTRCLRCPDPSGQLSLFFKLCKIIVVFVIQNLTVLILIFEFTISLCCIQLQIKKLMANAPRWAIATCHPRFRVQIEILGRCIGRAVQPVITMLDGQDEMEDPCKHHHPLIFPSSYILLCPRLLCT